jgi:hypothetical protein
MVSTLEPAESKTIATPLTLRFLKPRDIMSIEQALGKVGPDGEVRLAVENGRLFAIHVLTNEPVDQADLTDSTNEPPG